MDAFVDRAAEGELAAGVDALFGQPVRSTGPVVPNEDPTLGQADRVAGVVTARQTPGSCEIASASTTTGTSVGVRAAVAGTQDPRTACGR